MADRPVQVISTQPLGNQNLAGFYSQIASQDVGGGVLLNHSFIFTIEGLQQFPDINLVTMYAKGNKVPNTNILEDGLKYLGVNIKVPTVAQQESELDLSITADGGHKLHAAFMNWFMVYSNFDISNGFSGEGNKVLMSVTGSLQLLNNLMLPDGMPCYKLHGIMPQNVGNVSVSHDNATPAEFTVKLKYQYYTVVNMQA